MLVISKKEKASSPVLDRVLTLVVVYFAFAAFAQLAGRPYQLPIGYI